MDNHENWQYIEQIKHSLHQWTIRLTLELDAFRKKNADLIKTWQIDEKLASEWVDNTPFATKEIENNANTKFWSDNKEYHGIFEKGLLAWEYHSLASE